MSNVKAKIPAAPGDEVTAAALRQAIQALGISRDQLAELQGFTKRLLDEERRGMRHGRIEPTIIAKYRNEWPAWRTNPPEQMQPALRKCVSALRAGRSLLPPQSPPPLTRQDALPRPKTPNTAPPTTTTTTQPASPPSPPTPPPPPTHDAQTQTDDLNDSAEWFAGRFIRHYDAVQHHEVLEVQEVSTGKRSFVLVEDNSHPAALEGEVVAGEGAG
ncbi:hypothetical protein F5144DRAFT_648172 [Chaetomium tenue]|uniref:Uncharacterized protein n=1 Tax=Chaetomium tenue TaxID=1854479 RepID=A0ACB7P7N4_9PEZI|nr:hypothetical protein F5144DRAFT_648172 [Chaetomium globosum]